MNQSFKVLRIYTACKSSPKQPLSTFLQAFDVEAFSHAVVGDVESDSRPGLAAYMIAPYAETVDGVDVRLRLTAPPPVFMPIPTAA